MKKIISIVCCGLLLTTAVVAQEQEVATPEKRVKKELPAGWLPEAGDFAIGIDATPLLEYVGNAFSGKTNNTLDAFAGSPYNNITTDPSYSGAAPRPTVSIMGKYMLTDKLALRANIGILVDVYKQSAYSIDDLKAITAPLENAKVTDRASITNGGASIALGAEYRIGKRKVQGVFGGSLYMAFNQQQAHYNYGNAITELNQSPTSRNWGTGNLNDASVVANANNRVISDMSKGADSYVGVIGHIGVEYFFAPKISLGGEVNLSLYGSIFSKRHKTMEYWDPATKEVAKWTEITKPSASGFHFGTENIGANVFVHFYF